MNTNANTTLVSVELQERLDTLGDQEKVSVYVYLEDIDEKELKKELKTYSKYFDEDGLLIEKNNYKHMEEALAVRSLLISNMLEPKNREFLAHLQIDFESVFISKYTPIMVLTVDVGDVDKLAKEKDVMFLDLFAGISIAEEVFKSPEHTVSSVYGQNNKEAYHAIDLSYAHTSNYTGDGVKVGVLDANRVDSLNDELGQTIVVAEDYTNSTGFHATLVASIIAGREGIAPDVDIYSVTPFKIVGQDNFFIEGPIEWLISKNVSIINMSAAIGTGFEGDSCSGGYTSQSRYLDYVTKLHNVTFVKSAGNSACGTTITEPGISSNIIAAGSTNKYGSAVSSFSAHSEVNGTADKPNLVAPGEDIDFEDNPYGSSRDGTSFAAPMVTGAVALLVDKSPSLLSYPEKIIAILEASANVTDVPKYTGGTSNIAASGTNYEVSGLDNKFGAGVLNIKNALMHSSSSYTYRWSTSGSSLNKTIYVFGSSGDQLKSSTVWTRNNKSTSTYSNSVYKVVVKNPAGQTIKTMTSTYNNGILFDIELPTTGQYTINVTLISKGNSTATEEVSTSFRTY